jgi:cytochrome c oxidase subunit II
VGDRRVLTMLVVGLVATAIGIAAGLAIDWFPAQGAEQAKDIDTLYDVLVIASVPIFVLVTTVVVFAVIFFRQRPGQENEDGPPIHGNTRLEVIWTAIPTVLIAGLCAYSYVVLVDIEEAPAEERRELRIAVVGEQFAWRFTYPRALTNGRPLTVNDELVLPQGRPVEFRIQAEDVLHDFWVPAFRLKIDAVPGIETHYRVTPNRRGTFPVVCAELCGLGHATMRSRVRVVSGREFTAYLREAGQPEGGGGGEEGGGAQAAAGKRLFDSNGCSGCHTLADAGSNATVGPNLDETLQGKDEAYISEAITNPDAEIAQGFDRGVMPPFDLPEQDLDALVAYLEGATN